MTPVKTKKIESRPSEGFKKICVLYAPMDEIPLLSDQMWFSPCFGGTLCNYFLLSEFNFGNRIGCVVLRGVDSVSSYHMGKSDLLSLALLYNV